MTPVDPFEVYFRRPDDAVVYVPGANPSEVSLIHRNTDGSWHCALCNTTDRCRHSEAARAARKEEGAEA